MEGQKKGGRKEGGIRERTKWMDRKREGGKRERGTEGWKEGGTEKGSERGRKEGGIK